MSASSVTAWTIYCDHPGCKVQCTDEGVGGRRVTRASVRKYLARVRGWAVNVDERRRGDGLDYCPDHAALLSKRHEEET